MNENTKKALILSGVAFVTIMLIVLFVIVIVQFCQIAPLQKAKLERQAKLEALLSQKEYMQNAIEYVEGNKFIEEYARDVLGYGKDGEIKFVPKN